MNYKETVDFLYNTLPMFSRVGEKAFKKNLTNTLKLCHEFGNPQDKFKSIHIAGTNGKGSVSHMLAAILQQCGYKTGLYTSPHLKDFRERIKVNGVMAEEDFVVEFTERVKPFIARIEPSFFEITVVMAFDYFASREVDVAIIETGLGGRLDSTNVIHPLVSVITNIGWDHMNILGDSLPKIAFEKAGIIKERTPVIIGEENPEVKDVFEKVSAERKAPIHCAYEERQLKLFHYVGDQLSVELMNTSNGTTALYHLDLPGLYQVKNLITVLSAVDVVSNKMKNVDDESITGALRQVRSLTGLHGRWEMIRQNPRVILDVGHNVDGIKQIVAQLGRTVYHRLHIVIGMVSDKDISSVMRLLPRDASYYFTRASNPRSMPEDQLAEIAAQHGLSGDSYPVVKVALASAVERAGKEDLVLVCGSVFVVAEVEPDGALSNTATRFTG